MTSSERITRAFEFKRTYGDYLKQKTQTELTRIYLNMYGDITPLEALHGFDCFRLSARISELREEGMNIRTEISKGKKNYAIYVFEGFEGDEEECGA